MLENKFRTELSEFGEFGLIKHLTQNIELKNKSSVVGVGDDAAVLGTTTTKTVVTTDLLAEGVHFSLMYTPLKHLGYKAVAVNLSDVYAMNAKPEQITVSMAISSRFSVEAIEEIYNGIMLACERYGVDVVGGDTTSSNSGLVISVTAIGTAKEADLVYRSGAKPDDIICVSGDLGAAYMGLQVLEREKEVFKTNPNMQPDLSNTEYVLERQIKPEPRRDVYEALKKAKVKPTSMIDISDGLVSELKHICYASKVGCAIYEEKIPVDFVTDRLAEEFNLDGTLVALNGGEDYELLFTVSPNDFEKIKEIPHITPIGHILDRNDQVMITKANHTIQLKSQGWDAFEKRQSMAKESN